MFTIFKSSFRLENRILIHFSALKTPMKISQNTWNILQGGNLNLHARSLELGALCYFLLRILPKTGFCLPEIVYISHAKNQFNRVQNDY